MMLEMKGVSFRYDTREVLCDIDLALADGEWLGIVGANGAGKSTLLKLILGLIEPDAGTITRFGDPTFKAWHEIAYMRQEGFLTMRAFPASVEEIISMPLLIPVRKREMTRAAMHAEVERAMRLTGLVGFGKKKISDLSGGERQKVQIAQSIVAHPRLLLMDEPTTGLDERATAELEHLFAGLKRREAVSAIVISHDAGWLRNVVDRTLFLIDGRLGDSHA